MMKRNPWKNTAILATLALGATSAPLMAATINEDFESYDLTSTNGESFTDQTNDWVSSPDANEIVKDTTTANGTKVIEITADQDGSLANVRSKPANFDSLDGDIVVESDLRMLTESDGDIGLAFTDSESSSDRFFSYFRANNAALVLENGSYSQLKDSDGNTVSSADVGDWYHYRAVLHVDPNSDNDTYDLTVTNLTDGTELGTLTGGLDGNPSDITRAYLYVKKDNTGQFDNVSISQVPEPGSLALTGIGAGLVALLPRRRGKL